MDGFDGSNGGGGSDFLSSVWLDIFFRRVFSMVLRIELRMVTRGRRNWTNTWRSIDFMDI